MLKAIAMATVSDKSFDGYVVAYDREEIQFPVYVLAIGGAALIIAAFIKENVILLIIGFVIGCIAYYNYPLVETGRPRLAATRDGLFIEGLGLLLWRAIKRIDLVPVVVRASLIMSSRSVSISLSEPRSQLTGARGPFTAH